MAVKKHALAIPVRRGLLVVSVIYDPSLGCAYWLGEIGGRFAGGGRNAGGVELGGPWGLERAGSLASEFASIVTDTTSSPPSVDRPVTKLAVCPARSWLS